MKRAWKLHRELIHALFAMINDDMNQPVADWAGRRTDPQCDMNMSSKQGGYIKFLNWYQEKKLDPHLDGRQINRHPLIP